MKTREPIYGLDLIRFLSAMLVLGWHLAYRFFDPAAPHIRTFTSGVPAGYQPIQDYTRWGWIGVQIFFVISGLVIAYSAQGGGAWKFFLGRVGRLLPGVLICALIVLAIDIFYWEKPEARTLLQFGRTIIFWPLGDWIVPQFWTLPVEVAFYGVVWLMILSGLVRHLDRLAVGLWLLSAVYWAAVSFAHWKVRWPTDNVLLFQQGLYFAMGISLASIDRAGLSPTRIALLLGGVALGTVEIAFSVHKYEVYSAAAPMAWLIPYAIWLGFVTLIAVSLYWKQEIAAFVTRAGLSATFRILGLATFPLYLIHIHVGGLAVSLATRGGMAPLPAIALGAIACIPVAMAIAAWGEPPLRKLILWPFRSLGVPRREIPPLPGSTPQPEQAAE